MKLTTTRLGVASALLFSLLLGPAHAQSANTAPDLEGRRAALNSLIKEQWEYCLLYTSPSPRDQRGSRMPSSA